VTVAAYAGASTISIVRERAQVPFVPSEMIRPGHSASTEHETLVACIAGERRSVVGVIVERARRLPSHSHLPARRRCSSRFRALRQRDAAMFARLCSGVRHGCRVDRRQTVYAVPLTRCRRVAISTASPIRRSAHAARRPVVRAVEDEQQTLVGCDGQRGADAIEVRRARRIEHDIADAAILDEAPPFARQRRRQRDRASTRCCTSRASRGRSTAACRRPGNDATLNGKLAAMLSK
jgi:hypothetical protein